MRNFIIVFPCLLALVWAGPLTAQQEPDANVTFDGLVRVDNSRLQHVWADPDVDFSQFTQYIPGDIVFEFREVRASGGPRSTGQTVFPVSEADEDRVIEIFVDSFRLELLESEHFTPAEGPGAGVLIIEGALLDVISRVPPDAGGLARNRVYLDAVGEGTLVIQLRDSLTNAVIARGTERRAAQQDFQRTRSTPANNWAQVGRLARNWAMVLREGLDSFHAE